MSLPRSNPVLANGRKNATSSKAPKGAETTTAKRPTKAPAESKPEAKAPPPPPPPKAGVLKTYFDSFNSTYFALNGHGEYQRWQKDELKLLLRTKGFFQTHRHADGLSYLEGEMLRITQESSVHYAGSLGGYQPGLYDIHGCRVLVTRGPKPIEPLDGKWENLRVLLQALLGSEARIFCAWVKVALQAMRSGYPWSPGQLLAIAGAPKAGKSVLQSLITPLLGGRVSSPYTYMSSGTSFNSEIYGAEHGLIGDVNHAIDNRARRNFGSAIKKLVVEPVHYIHAKGKTPISLTPFLRLSLSLNDNADALMVLPSFDSDVVDKIILLRAQAVDFPLLTKRFLTWQEYYAKLLSELPAFVFYLRRWRIPESIADTRYGVVSYHNADLVAQVSELSEEAKLLDVIDTYLLTTDFQDHWSGTASQLEKRLSELMKPGETSRLFRYSSHCGQLLGLLVKKCPERVTFEMGGQHKKIYLIRGLR